jgi:hypothetical protein
LDANYGIGKNTYWLMSYGAKSAVSFDMDDRTLKTAEDNLKKYKEASKLSIYGIPYKNEFDVSFSIGAVHHLKFLEKAIDKLAQANKARR